MSVENLLPSFSDLGNISLIVLAAVAALFYFGKLSSSVKIEQYEKDDYYIEGFFFAFFYVGIPFILVLGLSELFTQHFPGFTWQTNNILLVIAILTEAIITYLLAATITFNHSRFTLFSQLKEAYTKAYNKEKAKKSLLIASAEKATAKLNINLSEDSLNAQSSLADTVCRPITIFLTSLILVLVAYATFISPPPIVVFSSTEISIVLYVLTFVNLTFLALAFGYINVYHPPATIHLDDGTKIEGKLVKIGKFLYIVSEKDHHKIFINSEKVVRVEEDMFKVESDEKAE